MSGQQAESAYTGETVCECGHSTDQHDRIGLCLTCFTSGDREVTCYRSEPIADLPYARHVDAYVRGDGTGFFMDCPRCHFYKNAVSDEGDTCRAVGCGAVVERVVLRVIPPVTTHALTEYGTTDCPVERVRAHVDDGECSACGERVISPASTGGES